MSRVTVSMADVISLHLIFSCGGTLRTLCMLRR